MKNDDEQVTVKLATDDIGLEPGKLYKTMIPLKERMGGKWVLREKILMFIGIEEEKVAFGNKFYYLTFLGREKIFFKCWRHRPLCDFFEKVKYEK